MSVSTLRTVPALKPDPSDVDLLETLASLLAAQTLPCSTGPLSRVVEGVCRAHDVPDCEARAVRLELRLAAYLHTWGCILRYRQQTPAALDFWAAHTSPLFLRIAVVGCARAAASEVDR